MGQLARAGAEGPAPPAGRVFRVYLTLRALSSLAQESVEGKEGRDEEEVTSALLPICKWRENKLGKHKTNKSRLPPPAGHTPDEAVSTEEATSPSGKG